MKGVVRQVEVAGPGFINIWVEDSRLIQAVTEASTKRQLHFKDKIVVAEYSDPNPFKILHAGHVYTTIVGDAIANLYELAGATVHRVNYGGDVGLHVGKTMWAILKSLGGEYPERLAGIPDVKRADWLALHYVEGNNAYETDEVAKTAIVELNKRVYQLFEQNDRTSPFSEIYWTCRAWSYQAFDEFYARLGTTMEKYYPESEIAARGLASVNERIGTVFERSDGAVVFRGDKFGLHTRVFINRQGLPTYEAKEVGLLAQKYEDYHFDYSVVVTANEQQEYMTVVMKAIEQFWPDRAQASLHIPHGMVKLAGGAKMSSRKGNIIRATDVLDMTAAEISSAGRKPDEAVVLGAVKYALLKNRIGGDILYDPKESIALEGNSGPYLQYAHARAQSIVRKVHNEIGMPIQIDFEPDERQLAFKISEFPEVTSRSITELMPHHIATYLYELAQTLNRFYERNRVIGSDRQAVRLWLVTQYAAVLKNGLNVLGITAPDKM